MTASSINKEQVTTLRRKVTDKMCKDPRFCLAVIAAALRIGGIKHNDILADSERHALVSNH